MNEVVVSVQGLSKQYRIGAREKRADTFFGAVKNVITAPFKNYMQIRNLTRGSENDETLFWALQDVSFEVKRGEVLGIIGPNGAGKSTLLKILSRITDPTRGEIMIKGRVSALLEVGTGFHPELTGRENVYMNGTILGMTKKEIDGKFDEIVDFSGIEKYLDTPVKFYSSGMRVRLAFSVAAHLEPEILIIDEVLAVGDAEFQKKCLGKMKNVSGEGRTILFVSHNLEAIRSLCSRAILLYNGKLEIDAEVNIVFNRYLSKHKVNSLMRSYATSDAPGNNDIKFVSAELLSENRDEQLTVASRFGIALRFVVVNPIDEVNLSLFLYTLSGNCIFNVGTPVQDLVAGEYESTLHIPGNLLNDDVYTIELFFIHQTSKLLFKIEDLLTFEILDTPRTGNWYGKWEGAIRPSLDFPLVKCS